jgi:hypothetical protein
MSTWILFITLFNFYNTVVGVQSIPGWMTKDDCEKSYQEAYSSFGKYSNATHICIEQKH